MNGERHCAAQWEMSKHDRTKLPLTKQTRITNPQQMHSDTDY